MAFVIAYSTTERGSDAIVSISADHNGIRLVFTHGVSLPDPHQILLGNARQTRYILLETSEILRCPEVESFLIAAVNKVKTPPSNSDSGKLILKSSNQRTKNH